VTEIATTDGGPESVEPEAQAGSRAAFVAFVAMLGVTAVLVPVRLGNQRWFSSDEWDFLATRHLGDVGSLFRPHNEHWTTLPAVAYRLVWGVVGLHHYWPYQALVIAAHLGAVAMLRVIMRRAGVDPWIATIAAGSLLLLGSGDENIVWAFQVTFVGAFALGLVQLVLADHDGDLDRRDWLGLAAGALGLMCSGVGLTMVVVVGVATLLRRSWRMAMFHTLPLAAMYAAWWVVERPSSGSNAADESVGHILGVMVAFVARGVSAAFEGLGSSPLVGAALALMLVVGLWMAWRPRQSRRGAEPTSPFRRRGTTIAALLVGMVVFLTVSAYGRWWAGAAYGAQSRYVYVVVAMLLPGLAVAADALARRWRYLLPVVLVLLLVGVPGNIGQFVDESRYVGPSFEISQQMVLAVTTSPLADEVPEWVEIDPRVNPGLTIGWLRQIRDAGDLPAGGPVDETTANQIPIRLGVAQTFGPPPKDCRTLTGKIDLRPAQDTIYGFSGSLIAVAPLDDAGEPTAPPLKFDPSHGRRLAILLDGLHLQVKPGVQGEAVTFCG